MFNDFFILKPVTPILTLHHVSVNYRRVEVYNVCRRIDVSLLARVRYDVLMNYGRNLRVQHLASYSQYTSNVLTAPWLDIPVFHWRVKTFMQHSQHFHVMYTTIILYKRYPSQPYFGLDTLPSCVYIVISQSSICFSVSLQFNLNKKQAFITKMMYDY